MTTEDRSDDANLHPTTLEYYPGDGEIRREIIEYMRHYEARDLRQMRRDNELDDYCASMATNVKRDADWRIRAGEIPTHAYRLAVRVLIYGMDED
jgi:hypothetical protein